MAGDFLISGDSFGSFLFDSFQVIDAWSEEWISLQYISHKKEFL